MSVNYMVLETLPYRYSTRARKLAHSLAREGAVSYISLTEAGRFGLRSEDGNRSVDGVNIIEAYNRPIAHSRALASSLRNIFVSYLPGFARILYHSLRMRARVVFVEDPGLLPVGILHRLIWRSRLVYDGRERPGGIRTPGSLRSLVSRLEIFLLPLIARMTDVSVAVCESHAREYAALGFSNVRIVRNVPLLWERPSAVVTQKEDLRVLYLGSLYQGRGLEHLLEAFEMIIGEGVRACLRIVGPGSPQYTAGILALIEQRGLKEVVALVGPCNADEVMGEYHQADVATVLYEAVDSANDSLPNKVFEAMMAGRCVLASDQPEVRALIEEHQCGVIVEPRASKLAEALRYLSTDRGFVRAAGDRGRSAAESDLNWDREVSCLLSDVRRMVVS